MAAQSSYQSPPPNYQSPYQNQAIYHSQGDPSAGTNQLSIAMGSLSVSGQPLQSSSSPTPGDNQAYQQIQQQAYSNTNSYVPHSHGRSQTTHQVQSQSAATLSQPLMNTNPAAQSSYTGYQSSTIQGQHHVGQQLQHANWGAQSVFQNGVEQQHNSAMAPSNHNGQPQYQNQHSNSSPAVPSPHDQKYQQSFPPTPVSGPSSQSATPSILAGSAPNTLATTAYPSPSPLYALQQYSCSPQQAYPQHQINMASVNQYQAPYSQPYHQSPNTTVTQNHMQPLASLIETNPAHIPQKAATLGNFKQPVSVHPNTAPSSQQQYPQSSFTASPQYQSARRTVLNQQDIQIGQSSGNQFSGQYQTPHQHHIQYPISKTPQYQPLHQSVPPPQPQTQIQQSYQPQYHQPHQFHPPPQIYQSQQPQYMSHQQQYQKPTTPQGSTQYNQNTPQAPVPALNKIAPKFVNDPVSSTTSFLGKSYKSTTKFLGSKKGMKIAAGGAGVLLAGFLGVEALDAVTDSGDGFVDSGSSAFDASGGGTGYDAGGGYGGGYDGGAAQMLEQQGQLNALNNISNQTMVQGGISISEAAGNTYS